MASILPRVVGDGTSSISARRVTATNNSTGLASVSLTSSSRNQFGFAALPRLVFLPETQFDEPLLQAPPPRRRRRKHIAPLPFSPPAAHQPSTGRKKKKSKKKRKDKSNGNGNGSGMGILSAVDEDIMVTAMIHSARNDAEVTTAAAKRALDVVGQHRVAQLRMRCECAAHLATAKSILRLLTSANNDGSASPVAHLPRIALRLIVSYLPLHQIQAQVAVDGRHFVYQSNGTPLRSNTSWPTASLSSDRQSITYVTISLSLRRDSSFEFVYREESAAIDQVSDRLVDGAPPYRTLQMEERINGEWYRERDIITLVYMKSSFFKAKPSNSAINTNSNNGNDTTNGNGTTIMNPSSSSSSPMSPVSLTPLVITQSVRDSVKSLPSSQSARARRLHQGGTAADGPLQVASFRVPKPPLTARAAATAAGSSSGLLSSSSRRRTHNGEAITHGGGNNGSAVVVSSSTRVCLDRSGRPMPPRSTANEQKTDDNPSAISPSLPSPTLPLPIPSMITSKATHEIVDGGEWQYHIMDVYVFHELALGVNARGLAMLHNHAGPFRLLPSTATATTNNGTSATSTSPYITISAADHGGVASLASSLLNNASAAVSLALHGNTNNNNGNNNDTSSINWDAHRRVRFVNRRPLHDIPFVLTAIDTHAPLINDT